MKIAFLADPLASFKTYKDSTYAMMVEAAKRGHTVYAFEQKDMAVDGGVAYANVAQITILDDATDWFRAAVDGHVFLLEGVDGVAALGRLHHHGVGRILVGLETGQGIGEESYFHGRIQSG